jgi:drug/metabolite transporter (DMT)-like permease
MAGNWVSIAVLGAAILGAVNVIDSHLISRRMPSLRAFLMPVGLVILAYGLILLFLFPLPEGVGTWVLMVGFASGLLRTTAITVMLYTMKRVEVSRIVPVVYTYPIFVAIMAVLVLGETLGYLEWIAIIIVVAGAVMVSARWDLGGVATWLDRSFFLLIGSSLLMAMADVAAKYALDYISFVNMYWITSFCISGVFVLISVRPHIIKQLGNIKGRKSVITLIVSNETMAVVGAVLVFWAMERGPVSLVSTIVSSRPIFVVIYALILSRVSPMFLEWQPGKVILALRLIAVIMIVGGIAIIYLN